MSHCKDCKFAEKYFRGLLCKWAEMHGVPTVPSYLRITGQNVAGLESAYPWMLDNKDYPDCASFEAAQPVNAADGAKAATLSGLYNCQVCGQEKCVEPGICDDCLAPPTEFELNQDWEA